ncbi:hypothetical protein [Coxiella-like endosymbiont]|uniref:hypothetical protein n=1 Tax=Coxiella-like endosymbiont TaxID=1592897 RepID=UPI0034E1FDF1
MDENPTLQPNPFVLVKASETLIKKEFELWSYCMEDLILCQCLIDVGCRILMSWVLLLRERRRINEPLCVRLLTRKISRYHIDYRRGIGRPLHAV